MTRRVIAVDGPAASGKSTTARRVARRLGWRHLSSGALYRAVAWGAARDGWGDGEGEDLPPDAELERRLAELELELVPEGIGFRVRVDGEEPGSALHAREVGERTSRLSTRRPVREAVTARLRAAAARRAVVCDGRDIGSVVFPDAGLKVFLTADATERARRRLADRGREATPEALSREADRLRRRDRRDADRELSPLRRTDDAVEVDTTRLSPDQVVSLIVEEARARGLAEGEG